MNLNEVSKILLLTREQVKAAIDNGIQLPKSQNMAYLVAVPVGSDYDIDETNVDNFISKFESEEPGHHPPVALRRQLLIEARHRCGICASLTPIEFHHIIDFAKIKHYDPQHMLALCPNCHTLCTNGTIDIKEQYTYKHQLSLHQTGRDGITILDSVWSTNFSWDDIRLVIGALHTSFMSSNPTNGNSRFDFSGIELRQKNILNHMGEEYFKQVVLEQHEPYFHRIDSFLKNPINGEIVDRYHQIVDELRSKIAANHQQFSQFEFFLVTFADAAVLSQPSGIRLNRQALNVLLSYMYVTCDIGRKQ